MDSEETKIYITLLIAGFIFFTVIVTFLITIINYQRKSVSAYLDRMKADFELSERERKRWASDIHDDFGSRLSAVKLLTDDFVSENEEEGILLSKISMNISDLMQSVRQISNSLVPYALQREGLTVSLDELIEKLFSGSSIRVTSDWNIEEGDMSEENKIHIYRIVQELFTNIIKHAHATTISISLSKIKNKLQLEVSDNGVGFKQKQVQKSASGLGLKNIQARVNVMKGDIYLTTDEKKGTSYLIELSTH